MRTLMWAPLLAAILSLSACRSGETDEFPANEYTVSITARIGNPPPAGRYQQSDDQATAEFVPNDQIGVFMDDSEAICWFYDGTAWSTEKTVYWNDKDKEHTFHAYYPYTEAVPSSEAVPMPLLTQQSGDWENISQLDFLVATCITSYQDTQNTGNISFSEDNAFKHVSSLLKIHIEAGGDLEKATIKGITLTGNGLTAPTTYSFLTGEVTTQENGTSDGNKLDVTLDDEQEAGGKTYYFILNGHNEADEDSPVSFTLRYSKGDANYKAERTGMIKTLLTGRIHEYNIQVKGGNVVISGGNISGWTPGDAIEDIIINGEEDKDSQTN